MTRLGYSVKLFCFPGLHEKSQDYIDTLVSKGKLDRWCLTLAELPSDAHLYMPKSRGGEKLEIPMNLYDNYVMGDENA